MKPTWSTTSLTFPTSKRTIPVCVKTIINATEGGFRMIFDRDVPFELRIFEREILNMVGAEVGSKE